MEEVVSFEFLTFDEFDELFEKLFSGILNENKESFDSNLISKSQKLIYLVKIYDKLQCNVVMIVMTKNSHILKNENGFLQSSEQQKFLVFHYNKKLYEE